MVSAQRIIGVVGGMGPYAGLDLVKKIFDQTDARTDQEHVPVLLFSIPGEIEDRTSFLAGKSANNPAWAILEVIQRLERSGATVVGIPCNTAHAPQIIGVINDELRKGRTRIKLIHMIEEVGRFIQENLSVTRRIGILGTLGTARAGIYQSSLEARGCKPILPEELVQENDVHKAIYDHEFGIKAKSNPVTDTAREHLELAIDHLIARGAEVILLACTEIPLAIHATSRKGVALLDPAMILARALLRETYPEKLKPL